jgi:hypothetical protein
MPDQFTDFVSIETNATTADQVAAFNVSFITLISNDGTDDVVFNFMGVDTNGAKSFTLKQGDSISEIPINCKVVHYRAVNGVQAIRIWGFK